MQVMNRTNLGRLPSGHKQPTAEQILGILESLNQEQRKKEIRFDYATLDFSVKCPNFVHFLPG